MISSLVTTGLFAQKKVSPLPVDSAFAFGKEYVVYALPQTAFQVEVTITLSHEFAGIYSQYADKLLGLTHVISSDKNVFSLKSVEIQAIAIPDTACMYAVELSSAQMKKGWLTQHKMACAESGLMQEPMCYAEQSVQIPDFFRYYSDLAYMEQTDSYTETQLVDGVVRQVPAQKKQMVAKSGAQQAQEAADMIGRIRDDRYELLTGENEVAYSSSTLAMMLEKLDELERNYLSLFTGFVVDEELHYTLVVTPDSTARLLPLFSVSPTAGFNTRLSAKPAENYYLQLEPEEGVNVADEFVISWNCSKGNKPNTGYRIRTPKATELTLMQGGSAIQPLGTRMVYQFGNIEVLPLNQNHIDIEKIGIIF